MKKLIAALLLLPSLASAQGFEWPYPIDPNAQGWFDNELPGWVGKLEGIDCVERFESAANGEVIACNYDNPYTLTAPNLIGANQIDVLFVTYFYPTTGTPWWNIRRHTHAQVPNPNILTGSDQLLYPPSNLVEVLLPGINVNGSEVLCVPSPGAYVQIGSTAGFRPLSQTEAANDPSASGWDMVKIGGELSRNEGTILNAPTVCDLTWRRLDANAMPSQDRGFGMYSLGGQVVIVFGGGSEVADPNIAIDIPGIFRVCIGSRCTDANERERIIVEGIGGQIILGLDAVGGDPADLQGGPGGFNLFGQGPYSKYAAVIKYDLDNEGSYAYEMHVFDIDLVPSISESGSVVWHTDLTIDSRHELARYDAPTYSPGPPSEEGGGGCDPFCTNDGGL